MRWTATDRVLVISLTPTVCATIALAVCHQLDTLFGRSSGADLGRLAAGVGGISFVAGSVTGRPLANSERPAL